jgi:hypothetical protein
LDEEFSIWGRVIKAGGNLITQAELDKDVKFKFQNQ